MRRQRARGAWVALAASFAIAAAAAAAEPAAAPSAANAPAPLTLTLDITPVEDPNDPTTMASLRQPLFVPDWAALAIALTAMVSGVAIGVVVQWRRMRP